MGARGPIARQPGPPSGEVDPEILAELFETAARRALAYLRSDDPDDIKTGAMLAETARRYAVELGRTTMSRARMGAKAPEKRPELDGWLERT